MPGAGMPGFEDTPGLVALAVLVRDCAVSGVGRRVLLLRTDMLPPRLSQPSHLRLAREALEPLDGADRAQRFELPHGRLALAWRGEAPELLAGALNALGHLLLDGPPDTPTVPELARRFDLPRDGVALLALAAAPSVQAAPSLPRPKPPTERKQGPARPLDLQTLEAMENRLSTGSVARFTRRRPVCRRQAASGPAPPGFAIAWETRFLHIGELMDTLAPGRDAYADPWLFRRLTRVLDRRMLALLSLGTELSGAGPFSLNLNLSGVLSPEFLRFDAALPAPLRGQAIIDLHPTDVLADVPGFRFARAFTAARGYRILLRGLTATLLPALDLAALDVDFAELRWSPSLAGMDPALLQAGATRWVLARADDAAALRWGERAGIGLFSGDAARPGVQPQASGRTVAARAALPA